MGARGKKPSNEKKQKTLALAPAKERPAPPDRLPQIAKDCWNQIIESVPPAHFKNSELPLLEKYCIAEYVFWCAMERFNRVDLNPELTVSGQRGTEIVNPELVIMEKMVNLQAKLSTRLRIATSARMSSKQVGKEAEEKPGSSRAGLMYGE